MINTVWGSTDKPISSKRLAALLARDATLEGTLYIGYPIIGTPEGSFPIDALLVSPTKGVVLFSLVEGRTLGDYGAAQDEAFNKMQAKLLQHQALVRGRRLIATINTVTFAPAVSHLASYVDGDHPLCDADSLQEVLDELAADEPQVFPALVSVIQAISTLRRGRKKRDLRNPESRGTKIKALEDSIANLDTQQGAAVVETFDGVQRIRGLAGSGKTIVLALKVAYLHARHPEWLIAVTFNTRSLKKQFEHLITTFVLEQANEEPDWDKVRILNAWGAPGGNQRTGIYFEFCRDHGVEYFDFRTAQARFGADHQFEGACDAALQSVKTLNPKYDAILVDEAQDFSPNFLLLCYEYLKEPKRLVYAYDELQNLGTRSLPPVEDIFGKNPDGSPRVTLHQAEPGRPKQDIILDICYRNSRPVLSTAHALGFGVYRDKGLVQIFENKNLWLDIGYKVMSGSLDDGQQVSLSRTTRSSPEFLERHSSVDDLICFQEFESVREQTVWLVESISRNLGEDELLPDDIVVINPDPLTTREAVQDARKALLERGINSNLAGVTSSADIFSEPGTVTFTGIFRAKGNEAAMVYVINAQDCFSASLPRSVARVRNRLFTAMTRSKGWVRVLGVGHSMSALRSEFEKVKAANFELRFRYPTEAERKQITIVNRDMSKTEQAIVDQKRNSLLDIIESLESGNIHRGLSRGNDRKVADIARQEIALSQPMKPKDTLNQILELTATLVGLSLSNEQNFPSTQGDPNKAFEITVGNAAKMSVALKNIAYQDIYDELDKARCYNFKMLDGALITLRYRFLDGEVCEHTLSYFPSSDLEHFQSDPELYLEDVVYSDVVARNIVPFPVRFDFSNDPGKFVEIHHPYSHLTLGQYENCRIPVCSPLGPLTFGGFILRNFYNTAYRKYSDEIGAGPLLFSNTITAKEREIPHVVLGTQ
jgi:superfamily I DNA and RNA helicase